MFILEYDTLMDESLNSFESVYDLKFEVLLSRALAYTEEYRTPAAAVSRILWNFKSAYGSILKSVFNLFNTAKFSFFKY